MEINHRTMSSHTIGLRSFREKKLNVLGKPNVLGKAFLEKREEEERENLHLVQKSG